MTAFMHESRSHSTSCRPLGTRRSLQLWRPKFLDAGYAIHGDADVPPYPVSHGCVGEVTYSGAWQTASTLFPSGSRTKAP